MAPATTSLAPLYPNPSGIIPSHATEERDRVWVRDQSRGPSYSDPWSQATHKLDLAPEHTRADSPDDWPGNAIDVGPAVETNTFDQQHGGSTTQSIVSDVAAESEISGHQGERRDQPSSENGRPSTKQGFILAAEGIAAVGFAAVMYKLCKIGLSGGGQRRRVSLSASERQWLPSSRSSASQEHSQYQTEAPYPGQSPIELQSFPTPSANPQPSRSPPSSKWGIPTIRWPKVSSGGFSLSGLRKKLGFGTGTTEERNEVPGHELHGRTANTTYTGPTDASRSPTPQDPFGSQYPLQSPTSQRTSVGGFEASRPASIYSIEEAQPARATSFA